MIRSKLLREPLTAYGSIAEIDPARVGGISEDRSAVVGGNNWCFIYEGSNNYRGAYYDKSLVHLGSQWAELIERRQHICDELGIRFIQLIIPNKATILPESFPEPLGDGVTTVLKSLLESAPDANLLCPIKEMRAPILREHIFRRNDSHLTLSGNAILAELLLDAAGIDTVKLPLIETTEVQQLGDLGGKFKNQISEIYRAPRFDDGLLYQAHISKLLDVQVEGFNGTRQDFQNSIAPIGKSVLVFGNSFFERVPSWGISPIFTAVFNKFYFLWTPKFDLDLILKLRPDIVISQTCERFLTLLPNDIVILSEN